MLNLFRSNEQKYETVGSKNLKQNPNVPAEQSSIFSKVAGLWPFSKGSGEPPAINPEEKSMNGKVSIPYPGASSTPKPPKEQDIVSHSNHKFINWQGIFK